NSAENLLRGMTSAQPAALAAARAAVSTCEPKATNGVSAPVSFWKATRAPGATSSPAARSTKTTRGRHSSIMACASARLPATITRYPSSRAVPVTLDVNMRSRESRMPVGPACSGMGTCRGSGGVDSMEAALLSSPGARTPGELPLDPGRRQVFQAMDHGVGARLAELGCGIGMGDADGVHAGPLGRDDPGQAVLDDQAFVGPEGRIRLGPVPDVAAQRLEGLQVARRIGLALVGVL